MSNTEHMIGYVKQAMKHIPNRDYSLLTRNLTDVLIYMQKRDKRIEELEAENKRLRECLEESMKWNWLDDDMPKDVVAMCKNALQEKDDEA